MSNLEATIPAVESTRTFEIHPASSRSFGAQCILTAMLHSHRIPRSVPALLTLLAASVTACKAPQAFGERNAIIVRADDRLWSEVDSAVHHAIEHTYFTSRPERIFNVTFVASDDSLWQQFRQFNQVVVIGTPDDAVVARLAGKGEAKGATPPDIFQVHDIWARGQTITVMVVPTDEPAAGVEDLLPELYRTLQTQYADWVRARMYASGVNDSLQSVLSAFGFSLQMPNVYTFGREDSVFRFKSAYPDQGSLLRSVLVTWQNDTTAVPSGEPPVGADRLLEWRRVIAQRYYDPKQDVLEDGARFDTATVDDRVAEEFRGVWQDESDFPAAGPFIARAVACPSQGRVYYMDAWVYAPGSDKYPYVMQLEVLLNSFRCSSEEPVKISGLAPRGRSTS